MKMPNQLLEFLKDKQNPNETYNSIKTESGIQTLYHCFWDTEEIESALRMRGEWDVELNQIPFYGDWHDLYCLEEDTLKVIEINDDRNVLNVWDSLPNFISSLCWVDEKPADTSGIVSSVLDF